MRARVGLVMCHASCPGWRGVDEHQRRVCGSEGDGAHAVKHSEYAGSDVWLWGMSGGHVSGGCVSSGCVSGRRVSGGCGRTASGTCKS